MPSPDILDLDSLLAPIGDDAPVGDDPRGDPSPVSPYYKVKDGRMTARDLERSAEAEEEPAPLPTEWRTVQETGTALLASQAKDLEIAAYVTEALVRLGGFPGLRDGFRLLHGLIERFWEDIYPRAEEGDDPVEERAAPLAGLNAGGSLAQPMLMVPLTAGYTYEPFAAWHYMQAVEIARQTDPDKREARIAAGGATLEMIQTAVKETPPDHLKTLKEDVASAREAFAALERLLDEKCGRSAPPTNAVRRGFEQVDEAMTEILRTVVLPEESVPVEEAAPAAGDREAPAGQGRPTGAAAPGVAVGTESIASREDAFRALLKIAEFFRRSEPHSPISYSLEELVRRGKMPLSDLLAELIPDEEARNGFLMRAGIEPPKPAEE
jgi:type VI secretion system protein ImpA